MKEIQYKSWKAQLPEFQRMREKCISEIVKIIIINPPQKCDQKILEIKNAIQNDYTSFCLNDYYDVIVYLIAERVNFSLDRLAQLFVQYFGLEKEFWCSKILQIALPEYFTNTLTIWRVREEYEKYLNFTQSPVEIGMIRSYRKRAKEYLTVLESLINRLDKLKMTELVQGIQNLYQKFHKQKAKYQTYIHKQNIPVQLQEETNVSMRRWKQAQSKLYNFPQAAQTVSDFTFGNNWQKINKNANNNTLMNYHFNIEKQGKNKSNINKDRSDFLKDKSSQQYKELYSLFQKLGKQQKIVQNQEKFSLFQLRNQFRSKIQQKKIKISKNIEQNSNQIIELQAISQLKPKNNFNQIKEFQQQHIPSNQNIQKTQQLNKQKHFTSIWNEDFYFFYEGCPFSQKKIDYSKPFDKNEGINYQIDSQTQFEEIEGEDIKSDEEISECDELSQSQINSLIDDDEDIDPESTLVKFQKLFGPRWRYDYKNDKELQNFKILQIYSQSQTLEIQITQNQIKRKKQEKQRRKKNSKTNQAIIKSQTQQSSESRNLNNKSQIQLQQIQGQEQEMIVNKEQIQFGDQQTRQIEQETIQIQREVDGDIKIEMKNKKDKNNDKNGDDYKKVKELNDQQSQSSYKKRLIRLDQIQQQQIQSSKITSINNFSNSFSININKNISINNNDVNHNNNSSYKSKTPLISNQQKTTSTNINQINQASNQIVSYQPTQNFEDFQSSQGLNLPLNLNCSNINNDDLLTDTYTKTLVTRVSNCNNFNQKSTNQIDQDKNSKDKNIIIMEKQPASKTDSNASSSLQSINTKFQNQIITRNFLKTQCQLQRQRQRQLQQNQK